MRADVASRVIAAEPSAVFRAFTEPDALVAWMPPQGMTGRLKRFDPRPGGGYRLVLTYDEPPRGGGKATADTDVADSRFVEIDPPRRLVQEVLFPSGDGEPVETPTNPMTMTWTFEPRGGGTEVTVRATDVPSSISPEDHAIGLASSLEKLAALVE